MHFSALWRTSPLRTSLLRTILVMLAAAASLVPAAVAQTGLDPSGKAVNPLHSSPGKLTVLVFVRTDCPISNRYAPEIERLSARFATEASFWLIFPDPAATAPEVQRYLQDFGYTLPGLRDRQHELVRISQAAITPEAAVFTPAGELIYHGRIDNWFEAFGRTRPAATTHELEEAIQAGAAGRKPASASEPAVGCYISDLR